jgi:hypothetical protein
MATLDAEAALRNVILAWEAMPGPQSYAARDIEVWLHNDMFPAITEARRTLGLPLDRPSREFLPGVAGR